jgi:hypothetical protein
MMKKSVLRILWWCVPTYLASMLLAACAAQPQTPSPSPTAIPTTPTLVTEASGDTLATLIVAEREASIRGDAPLLAALWAEDGRIIDGRGSVTQDDDYVWAGRAAILDRYEVAVFAAPPPPLTLEQFDSAVPSVEGESATLIYGNDRWRFVQREGRWWLYELTYSAPEH